ncbi:MAG: SDR family NAD(P)-dependent oxidoreductase [Candidatus Limnocylindrales bacterium]|jgi:NAD(P)-dependent dehydrogenase (short-subunit alcohol dehydrogenase family)
MELDGAVVIVTGASSGIGAATARLAAGRGSKVVPAARRSDRVEDLADAPPERSSMPPVERDLAAACCAGSSVAAGRYVTHGSNSRSHIGHPRPRCLRAQTNGVAGNKQGIAQQM